MKLYEHESKNALSKYEIPAPKGIAITSAASAQEAAAKLKPPYAVKAQVLVAGRGKASGIVFADSAEMVKKTAEKLLTTQIKGIPVKTVLVEEKLPVKRELYFGITIDRPTRRYVAIAATQGGMEIETLAATNPQAVLKIPIDPRQGFRSFHARQMARKLGYTGDQLVELSAIFEKLYTASRDCDAELIELNPLAETVDGRFVALDARIIIDDNALFRHPEYRAKLLTEERERTPQEIEAAKSNFSSQRE